MRLAGMFIVLFLAVAPSRGQDARRTLRETEYHDRLVGMWLGQVIANWTGLRTEGRHRAPPFLTDVDWGLPYNGFTLDFTWYFNPWPADDDTDIEYVYAYLAGNLNRWEFTPAEIRDAWIAHINRAIFVSNRKARDLMTRGVLPPMTGSGVANADRLMIDAQLTTEIWGAAFPGMPERALLAADLPVRTSASGYAAHAAQYYIVLYSLATQVDPGLSGRDQVLWLSAQARRHIPETSKTADIIDFVTAEYLANPDVNNWELTRDRIYQRYHANAPANGFVYRDWFESSVNVACGVMALLYGEGDYRRTVQIGTMSGWDSDNCTATLGGLIGLMGGRARIQAAFPGSNLSDLFDVDSRRDALPDFVPGDPNAEDRITFMAARMIPSVRENVQRCGGVVDVTQGLWRLPPVVPDGSQLPLNPLTRDMNQSANQRVAAAAASSVIGAPPSSRGVGVPGAFANGYESDQFGREEDEERRRFFSTEGAPAAAVTLTVTYQHPVSASVIRFIEGNHYAEGGWMLAPRVQVRSGGGWIDAPGAWISTPDPSIPFQILDWGLPSAIEVDGVRVSGEPGGSSRFVTCAELDVLSPEVGIDFPTLDINGDGLLTIDDLHAFERNPVDLNGDGLVTPEDRQVLIGSLRLSEGTALAVR